MNSSNGSGVTAMPASTTYKMVGSTDNHYINPTLPPCVGFRWTEKNVEIAGIFLWIVMVLILVGNLSCFYAVWKNIRKIMEHPFFQSNVLCIYLSIVDIMLVLCVGIPTAFAYTTHNKALSNSSYSSIANILLNYFVWLQLVLIVGICIDRAGHIARPLRYAFGLTMNKTILAIVLSTVLPFLASILPEIIIILSNPSAIACSTTANTKNAMKSIVTWQHVGEWLIIALSIIALLLSNALIVYKLYRSPSFQQRKESMEKSIKISSLVTIAQVCIILASVIPYRQWTMHRSYSKENGVLGQFHAIIVRLVVFFGPICNPWLYPIRMASIRTFLRTKRQRLVHSVSHSLLRMRARNTIGTHQTLVEDEKKSFIPGSNAPQSPSSNNDQQTRTV